LLGDFGLCLGLEDERLTGTWEDVGPRKYTAPENEDGINEDLDQRPADCYAFAKLCWSLLAGRQALPRELQLEPQNRLEVLTGEPTLGPLGPLFERLLDKDPRARLTDWSTILSEVNRVYDSVRGANERAPASPRFDLEATVAKARQLAANGPMLRQRAEQEKERDRIGVEIMLRRLMFLEFKSALEELADKVSAASDGSLSIRLGSGRDMQDQLSTELSKLIDVEPLPSHFLNQPAAASIMLSRWVDEDGSSAFQLLVLLVRKEEDIWLLRVPMRRKPGYEYPLLAADLTNLIERVGPYPLRLDSTKQRVRDFVSDTAILARRIVERYVELAQAETPVWKDGNWAEI
jgi:hypothetical protein